MEQKITVTCVTNPFDPLVNREVKNVESGKNIAEYLREFYPLAGSNYPIVASVNGRILDIDKKESYIARPGDNIALCAVPTGGGDDGKNPLATVAMLAVMVVASAATGGLAAGVLGASFASGAVGAHVLGAGIMLAGGLLVNTIFPSAVGDSSSAYDSDGTDSPTYGWSTGENATSEGIALPVVYGTHRITPPLISKHVTTSGDIQYLNLLYAVADHYVSDISQVEINGMPYTSYDDVSIESRLGTASQTVISNFLNTETDVSVNQKLTTSWHEWQTQGNSVAAFGVGISLPEGLFYADTSGELTTEYVYVTMEYRTVGAVGWTFWQTVTISGATSSGFQKYYQTGALTPDQYEVRVKLAYALDEGSRYRNATYFEYMKEVVLDNFTYPSTALLGVKAMATDQISGSMPSVTCLVERGDVQVWNGSAYVSKPSSNPAWACYDLLHNNTYGGDVSYSRLTYSDFSNWADWCDTQGYTVNIYFDSSISLRQALDRISLLGRASIVQMGSKFSVIVDKADTPTQKFLFTVGNIISDSFQEEFIQTSDRANAVEVTYFDADIDYSRQVIEVYSDDFDTTTREINSSQVILYGCTDRTQAIKYAKACLNRNRYITVTASWEADIDSIACMPGDLVDVQHDVPQWGYGGRIVSATATTVTLDQEVTLDAGTSYVFTSKHADDDARETVAIASVEEETTTATLTLDIGESWANGTPNQYDLYSFGAVNSVYKVMRISSITRSQDMRRKITAVEYVEEVYDDSATIPAAENPSSLDRVKGVNAQELYRLKPDGSKEYFVSVTWRGSAIAWQVYYKDTTFATSSWIYAGQTNYPYFELSGLIHGKTYSICVTYNNLPTDGVTDSVTINGYPIEPDAPEGLALTVSGSQIVLDWDSTTDVGIKGYNIYLNSSLLVSNFQGNKFTYSETLMAGVYSFEVYALDSYGQESTSGSSASTTISVPSTPSPSDATNGEMVEITWSSCKTSLPIDYYTVNGTNVGNTLKYTERVSWSGDKDFDVIAYDVAGNNSSTGSVTVTITTLNDVTGLTAIGIAYGVNISLTYTTFDNLDAVEIWASETNARSGASKIGETKAAVHAHSGLEVLDTYYYWARTRDIFGNYGSWYPSSSTGGVSGSVSTTPSTYLTALTGGISETYLTTDLNTRINIIDTDYVYQDGVFVTNGTSSVFASLDGLFEDLLNSNTSQTGSISSLLSTTATHTSQISSLETEIGSLTTTPYDNSISYSEGTYVSYNDKVYRCIQGFTYPPTYAPTDTSYWEESNSIVTLINSVESRVDTLEGEIVNKVSQTTFDALENTVDSHTTSISQNAANISLKADQTTVNALSSLFAADYDSGNTYDVGDYVMYDESLYKCILIIDFTPAPAPTNETYWEESTEIADRFETLESEIDINTGNITIASSLLTGPLVFVTSTYESGVYVESLDDLVDYGLDLYQAVIDLDAAEASITLNASNISGVDTRLSAAEIDIDGLEAEISLLATTTNIEALETRIDAAEVAISAGQAGSWTSISNKVSTTTYESDQEDENGYSRIAALENRMAVYDTNDAPDYDSLTQYDPGDIVVYSDSFYRCIKTSTGNLPTNATYWVEITAGLLSQWTLKLNVNGHIAGVGLILNDEGESEFQILANKFQIINQNSETDPPTVPFSVGTVNGSSTVGINGNLMIDGSILAEGIGANEINATHIEAGSITATEIAAGTITGTNIASNTITTSNIAANTIQAGNIQAGSIGTYHISTNQIVAHSSNIKNLTVDTIHVANGAITSPILAYLYGPSTIPNGSGSTIKLIEITNGTYHGQNVILTFSCQFPTNYGIYVYITRDYFTTLNATVILSGFGGHNLTIVDQAATAGTHTYSVYAYGLNTTNSLTGQAANMFLHTIEYLK